MADLIKRIDEFYVGFKEHAPTELPLAFLTPFDTTAAFKKRKDTVDTWAQGYGHYVNGKYTHKPHPAAKNITNEPLAGFAIAKSVKRTGGWNSGNVVWRIEDPRGFEWEIPSANLAQIIVQTGISAGGVINGRCIIGRLGSTNILIPEGTDLWDQMEKDVETRKARDSVKILKDIKPGDSLTLKSGERGRYMGRYRVNLKVPSNPALRAQYGSDYGYERAGGTYHTEPSVDEYYIVKDRSIGFTAYKGNPPVTAVDPADAWTAAQVDAKVRELTRYGSFSGRMKNEKSQDLQGGLVL
jgi:hypothetical protein